MREFRIYNEDCIQGANRLEFESVDLVVCDPPFGINEGQFDKHYNRKAENVLAGYTEAPPEYAEWTLQWMAEAVRILKPSGSLYVIMGHSNLRHVLNAAAALGLQEINHAIWKFNFGVATKTKFVTSHYHVLYYARSGKSEPTFNTFCRFAPYEEDDQGGSLLYQDLEDVFVINREYNPGQKKNQNKLPEELLRKIVLYSSKEGDVVCDFFMGNFTTAAVAHGLGRQVCGFEINKEAFDYHMTRLQSLEFGADLKTLKKVDPTVPENQGKPISEEDAESMYQDYKRQIFDGKSSKEARDFLQEKYKRGRFSIQNILSKYDPVEISNTLDF